MGAGSLPDDFASEILVAEYAVHQYFQVMARSWITVKIDASFLSEDAP